MTSFEREPLGQRPELLRMTRIGKTFQGGVKAVSDLSLTVQQGDFISLLGPSGCGKSTAQWQGGQGEGDLGVVFQEPTLMPWARVKDNVWLPFRLRGRSYASVADKIEQALALVGLQDFQNAFPRELSGGMKMRVSMLVLLVGGWQAYVTLAEVPHYILPSPVRIAQTLVTDWAVLWPALLATARLTFLALLLAIIGGLLLAIAFTQSKWAELAMFPYAVILLPFFLGGLKIAGGLALIGAVVAEFVIGRAGTGLGLASTLLEASYRFNFGRLYAALILISVMGIAIFGLMSLISHLCLFRWHESAVKREA